MSIVFAVEVCYRHSDRETGVGCSSCERPICPDCMTTTSVGMRCPECARQKTRVKTMGSVTEPVLTYGLMAANVLVWIAFALSGSSSDALYLDLGLSRFGLADGQLWQVLTGGFMHARLGDPYGFIHIFSNMFSLFILGGMLEPTLGRLRFGIVYFVSILTGSLGALLASPDSFTVGASGAVFGLMGAAVVVMRNRGINPMENGLGLWIGLNLLITFTIPNISIGGHIGGLLGGGLAALAMFELRDRVALPRAVPMLLAAAIGVLAAGASVAIAG